MSNRNKANTTEVILHLEMITKGICLFSFNVMYVSQQQFKQSASNQTPRNDKLSILTYLGMGVITTRPSNKHL